MKASLQISIARLVALLFAGALAAQLVGAETPDPIPDHPERGPFLFCYFLGNGDGLHLAYSTDGLRMTPLAGKIFLKPTIGSRLLRDPCIRQGADGIYHLVWTSGWWDKGFGVASSPDLIHWSPERYVEVNKDNPTAINTWAPELFYNDQKNEWMIFWATTIPGRFSETEPESGRGDSGPNKNQSLNHRIYYVTTKDFENFSEPKLLVDPGFNCIDATIAKLPREATSPLAGKYVMVIKDETVAPDPKKNLRVLSADSPEGPWSAASEPVTKDWVEGPSVAQVGDTWYVYYDEYRNRKYGAVRTTDFRKFEVVEENFAFPNGARHGTVLPTSATVIERLQAASNVASESANSSTTDLSGNWRFSLDRSDEGVKEKWFNRELTDYIKLPGILQSQGYGDEISTETPWVAALPRDMRWYLRPEYKAYTTPGHVKVPYLSQPPRHYLGVAWYQRDIEVPKSSDGKRISLLLERPRWETTVWVDDKEIGSNNSLVAPHEFDLGSLTPGKHVLSVRIDNRMILPYRPDGHSVSDALGSTWNGIVGRIELSASSPVWIDEANVFPDVKKKSALVKVQIGNQTGQPGKGTLSCGSNSTPVSWDAAGGTATIDVPLGDAAELWDEFQPQLQNIKLRLEGDGFQNDRELTFGLREITTEGKKMLLNGREINLRGTHFGGDFPLTGYPATDIESWKRIIQICKDFGLNHIRFHSWCPPEAAFTAADELGFYLQPECGMWNSFTPGGPIAKMLEEETARMLKAYGNHPSFLLLSPSNEPAGRWPQVLPQWAGKWHDRDPRRLYADKSGWAYQQTKGPQYAIVPIRGNRGWFGRDFTAAVENIPVPVLSHEVGQYCSYPNFDVIEKFTGYLQPGNYEIFRDSAREHGVLEMNRDFAVASGKFQLACYKEEIEANLRTPGLSGFQLLDLHDYLGQGGALIGLLDAFWGSKGYATPEEFQKFCGPTVPLARFRKYECRNNEPFEISVEAAHFGAEPVVNVKPIWLVRGRGGRPVADGPLARRDLPIGKNIPLGTIKVELSKLQSPGQYTVEVVLTESGRAFAKNQWNFWLYPAEIDTSVPTAITVTSDWKTAESKLAEGGKVLFTPPESILDDTCPPLNNVPVFWNRLMNPKLESMLGLLVDAKHSALAEFPTEEYCDWQWANLVRGVRTVNFEKAAGQLHPIVQAIDDWSRNYKLAVIFECRVGEGRLMVCTIDVANKLADRPAAAQLRRSLLDYMANVAFNPSVALSPEQAKSLWPALEGRGVKSAKQSAPPPEIEEAPAFKVAPKKD